MEEVESNISFSLMRDLRFITRKELELYIRNFYEEKGLKLKISQHSDKVRLSMKCLAGNKYKPKGNGVRDNPTRLNNCPFEVLGRYSIRTDRWRVTKINGTHNHPPSSSYVEYRKFNQEET